MSTEDREAQEDELLALASIYCEDEFRRAETTQGGEIRLCLELPSDFKIFVSGNAATNIKNEDFEDSVCFLPPIVLNFELPPDYPSSSPPMFTLSCKWLSTIQLTALCKQLDSLWDENRGCVVLFAWMQFLKEEALEYLHIVSPFELKVYGQGKQNCTSLIPRKVDLGSCEESCTAEGEALDERAIQDVESLSSLIRDILDFDQAQQKKCFNSKLYMCNICFSEKMGSDCMYFKECEHVYCSACLKDYFESQIKEGQVHSLNCPEPECASVATPAQVKELVDEQLFSRYDRLLLQSSIDAMADVVYCPRASCQTPVMQEPGCTMGICSSCCYPFCTLCKMTYHGISRCKTEEEDQPIKVRCKLPKRRRKEIVREEVQSAMFIEEKTKPCPACGVPIQKDGGCEHMMCSKCQHRFNWPPPSSTSLKKPS